VWFLEHVIEPKKNTKYHLRHKYKTKNFTNRLFKYNNSNTKITLVALIKTLKENLLHNITQKQVKQIEPYKSQNTLIGKCRLGLAIILY
jgi:hypothetical protein